MRRTPKSEIAQRLAKIANVLLGLEALLARKPGHFRGQQQRVALGRALIAETPVCLLDEPLSNLDQPRQVAGLELRAAGEGRRHADVTSTRPRRCSYGRRRGQSLLLDIGSRAQAFHP